MNETLFYILQRRYFNEPLVGPFLFGVAEDNGFVLFDQCGENDTVDYSKNIARFPKIIGDRLLAVPTDLMLDLRPHIVAKWRRIVISKAFTFEWSTDGFELFEEYQDMVRAEFESQGMHSADIDTSILSDPDLVYHDFVKRYGFGSYQAETNYWEMVVNSSGVLFKKQTAQNGLLVSKKSEGFHQISPITGDEKPDHHNMTTISTALLEVNQILRLFSQTYAISPSIMPKLEPYIEPECYTVQKITATDISDRLE